MPMFPKNIKVDPALLGVFVLTAFALRAAYLILSGPGLVFPDEKRFYAQIQSLAASWSFPHGLKAHDMPLTALLFAGIVRLTDCGLLGIKLFLCGLSALTLIPVGMIAGHLYPSRWSVYLACIMACVYPFFIFYSRLLLSESVFLFFLTSFFAALMCLSGGSGGALSALFAGMSHLVRPTLLYFLPVAGGWALWKGGWKLRHAACALLVFAVVVAPWVVRNVYVMGSPILTTANSGHVLWEGNNPWNPEGATAQTDWGYLKDVPVGLDEVGVDAWKRERAVSFIKENPVFFMRASLHKFGRFWNPVPNHPSLRKGVYLWGSLLSFGPVLLLSLAGFFVLRSQWDNLLLLWSFIGYYTLLHMVTIGSIRYRLPLEPLLLAMAAAVLVRLAEYGRKAWSVRSQFPGRP